MLSGNLEECRELPLGHPGTQPGTRTRPVSRTYPWTMLRYALEKLDPEERDRYMNP